MLIHQENSAKEETYLNSKLSCKISNKATNRSSMRTSDDDVINIYKNIEGLRERVLNKERTLEPTKKGCKENC